LLLRSVKAADEHNPLPTYEKCYYDGSFPKNAIGYCLKEAGVRLDELSHVVVFYDKPFPKFERLLETYIALAPRGFRSFRMAIPLWLKEKLFKKSLLKRELKAFAESFDMHKADHDRHLRRDDYGSEFKPD
jgi:carbamoyltransferase